MLLFLAYNESESNLGKAGLLHYCPKRSVTSGRNPLFTASGTSSNRDVRWKNWIEPTEEPEDNTLMVVYAIGITLKYTLANHICSFNNVLYKQLRGGAIGVGIAGDVATLMMVWWDRQLKAQFTNFRMYGRYVDDIDLVVETDCDDKTTMEHIQEVANTIHPSIQVSIDYPTNHDDGRLPVLDTKQWIEGGKLLHTFYSKSMSSKYVIMSSSAVPVQSKHHILVSDLLRVMRSVSPLCDPSERIIHVQDFIHRMQLSGYNQEQRVSVYKAAKTKYDKQLKDHEEGVSELYL